MSIILCLESHWALLIVTTTWMQENTGKYYLGKFYIHNYFITGSATP